MLASHRIIPPGKNIMKMTWASGVLAAGLLCASEAREEIVAMYPVGTEGRVEGTQASGIALSGMTVTMNGQELPPEQVESGEDLDR